MAIYLSAGHHFAQPKGDPGAVATHGGKTYREADLVKELRDLTLPHLKAAGAQVITDKDHETLGQYLARIQPGSGSVVCELHFNASDNAKATGVEVVVADDANAREIALGEKIAAMINRHTGLVRRGKNGVIREGQTARRRLALMREPAGIVVLVEVAFISNANDVAAYQRHKAAIARDLAALLVEADGLA